MKESKHHGSAKRPVRKEIVFSDVEWQKIVGQFQKSGFKKIGLFMRRKLVLEQDDNAGLCRNGELITALNNMSFSLETLLSDKKNVSKVSGELNKIYQDLTLVRKIIFPDNNDRENS